MNDKLPIILLDELTASVARQSGDIGIIDVEINVLDEALHAQIGVKDCPATLADIVPMARALSAKIGQFVRRKMNSSGFAIPCRKGCIVCCYHLICLSVPEAFRLMEEVTMMSSGTRQGIMQSCRLIAGRVRTRIPKMYFILNRLPKYDVINYFLQIMEISDWYFGQKVPCPFLYNNLCTIYKQRPIVCSQHLVIGSTSPCRFDDSANVCKVEVPIGLANVLTELSSELEQTDLEPVVLPCVFDWYEKNNKRHKRTWPAQFLVERFVDISLQFQEQRHKESRWKLLKSHDRKLGKKAPRILDTNPGPPLAASFQQS